MPAIDIDAMLAALAISAVAAPEPVGGGWGDAQLWRVELAGGPAVLRIYARHDEPVVRREAQVLTHLAELDFPVARVLATGTTDCHALLLLEWLDGQTLGEAFVTADDPGQLGEQFGQLQGRLHAIEAPSDLPHALSWPSMDAYPRRLVEALEGLPQRTDRLLHLDYHPLNVLVEGDELSGLIDWTNVRRGDPRYDVARTFLIVRFLSDIVALQDVALRRRTRSFLSAWHRAYRVEHGALRDVSLFLAWAAHGLVYDLTRKSFDDLSAQEKRALDEVLARLEQVAARWQARGVS